MDRVDELVGGLVVLDTVNETLELVLELLGISLPVGVLLQQCLSIVKQARCLSGSGSGSNVTGLVEEPVDIRLEVVEVEAELLVVLDVVGGLLSVGNSRH